MKNSISVPITLQNGNEKRHLPFRNKVRKETIYGKEKEKKLKKEITQQRKTSSNIYRKETRIIISNERSNYI